MKKWNFVHNSLSLFFFFQIPQICTIKKMPISQWKFCLILIKGGAKALSRAFLSYKHYDLLMMSQKESPRNHPWVLPRKVDKIVWISAQWVLPTIRQGRAGQCMYSSRNHPGITYHLLLPISSIFALPSE